MSTYVKWFDTERILKPTFIAPSPAPRNRSLSPAGLRKAKLLADRKWPRSFTVEAICAIPHPVSTHALASSLCMSHLITGSEDGYIRDYDIFSAVNGKVFLTAPQRHHCGVMEGLMKAAQIKCWWENPADMRLAPGPIEDPPLSPVYSLLMHSDALWSLAGTEVKLKYALLLRYLFSYDVSKGILICSRYDMNLVDCAILCMVIEDRYLLSACNMMRGASSALVGMVRL